MLYKFLCNERGNVLVFTAAALFSLLIFTGMATDIGYILTAKNQLQSAVDAASLAGAVGLMNSQAEAKSKAIRIAALNKCVTTPVVVNSADVTFPTNLQIRVRATRTLNTFFMRLININTKTISTESTGQVDYIKGTTGMAPFCVPNGNWQNGDRVVLKAGGKGELGTSNCWNYPVNYPPVNRGRPVTGASAYNDNLVNGSISYAEIGDVLQIEPGNMKGPTSAGVAAIVARDPSAAWLNGAVVNSSSKGFTSPRIIIIPMYDPNYPPVNGRGDLTITSFGAYFVEGMSGDNVIGVFMNIITDGTLGTSYSMLHKIRMVN